MPVMFGFGITLVAGCAVLKSCSLAGGAGFYDLSIGAPDSGGLVISLMLLRTAKCFNS